MKSSNITVTDARLARAFKQVQNITTNEETDSKIKEEVAKSKIQLGEVTKFYPYLDKAEVTLKDNKNVLCKVLHNCWGSLIDFFTPAGDRSFCENLKTPYIIPMYPMPCVIASIDNTNEYLLLGYYANHEITGISPANQGEFKIIGVGDDEYHISFDGGSFNVTTRKGIAVTEKSPEDSNSIEYYTKEEVDKLIASLKSEILEELME